MLGAKSICDISTCLREAPKQNIRYAVAVRRDYPVNRVLDSQLEAGSGAIWGHKTRSDLSLLYLSVRPLNRRLFKWV